VVIARFDQAEWREGRMGEEGSLGLDGLEHGHEVDDLIILGHKSSKMVGLDG
jgi:hypothetical protein